MHQKSGMLPWPRFHLLGAQRIRLLSFLAALAALVSFTTTASPAEAYNTTGRKWGTATLRMNVAATSQNARTAINQAAVNFNQVTPVTVSNVTVYSAWAAENIDYGATGWEGTASWYCEGGVTKNSQTRLNNYYLSGKPIEQLRVVWLHEMGHSLGLDHVTSNIPVMYTYPSTAYNNGARYLRSDDISGIQFLY